MPCIKCNNGKWKYGKHGKCVFVTLQKCKDAAAAIHANPKSLIQALSIFFSNLGKECKD